MLDGEQRGAQRDTERRVDAEAVSAGGALRSDVEGSMPRRYPPRRLCAPPLAEPYSVAPSVSNAMLPQRLHCGGSEMGSGLVTSSWHVEHIQTRLRMR